MPVPVETWESALGKTAGSKELGMLAQELRGFLALSSPAWGTSRDGKSTGINSQLPVPAPGVNLGRSCEDSSLQN